MRGLACLSLLFSVLVTIGSERDGVAGPRVLEGVLKSHHAVQLDAQQQPDKPQHSDEAVRRWLSQYTLFRAEAKGDPQQARHQPGEISLRVLEQALRTTRPPKGTTQQNDVPPKNCAQHSSSTTTNSPTGCTNSPPENKNSDTHKVPPAQQINYNPLDPPRAQVADLPQSTLTSGCVDSVGGNGCKQLTAMAQAQHAALQELARESFKGEKRQTTSQLMHLVMSSYHAVMERHRARESDQPKNQNVGTDQNEPTLTGSSGAVLRSERAVNAADTPAASNAVSSATATASASASVSHSASAVISEMPFPSATSSRKPKVCNNQDPNCRGAEVRCELCCGGSSDSKATIRCDKVQAKDYKFPENKLPRTRGREGTMRFTASIHAPVAVDKQTKISVVPSTLDFGDSFVCVPNVQVIKIKNLSSDKDLVVHSITSNSVLFRPTFRETSLGEESEVSVQVVFLARISGEASGALLIHTSEGVFRYPVHGTASPNLFDIQPLLDIKVNVGKNWTHDVSITNRLNDSVWVKEVHTVDPFIVLTHASHRRNNAQKDPRGDWKIFPNFSKKILHLWFKPNKTGEYHGFVYMQTSITSIVIPLEFSVVDGSLLLSGVENGFDFGVLSSPTENVSLPITVQNSTPYSVRLVQVEIDPPNPYMRVTIDRKRLSGSAVAGNLAPPPSSPTTTSMPHPSFSNTKHHHQQQQHQQQHQQQQHQQQHQYQDHQTQGDWELARLEFLGAVEGTFSGTIRITCAMNASKSLSQLAPPGKILEGEKIHVLEAPYSARVLHGALTPVSGSTATWRGQAPYVPAPRPVELTNHFKVPITILAAHMSDDSFEIEDVLSTPIDPGATVTALTLLFRGNTNDSHTSQLVLRTNGTTAVIPVHLYHGKLDFSSPWDCAGRSCMHNSTDQKNHTLMKPHLDFGVMALNKPRTKLFNLTNTNPVSVHILSMTADSKAITLKHEGWCNTVPTASSSPQSSTPTTTAATSSGQPTGSWTSATKDDPLGNPHVMMDPKHCAVFSVTFQATEAAIRAEHTITIVTPFETLTIPVLFSAFEGELRFEPHLLTFDHSFPGRVLVQELIVESTFNVSMVISGLASSDPRITPQLFRNKIAPNNKTLVGSVIFDAALCDQQDNYLAQPHVPQEESHLNTLTLTDLEAFEHSQHVWSRLLTNNQTSIQAWIVLKSNVVPEIAIEVLSGLVRPSVVELEDATSLDFGLSQIFVVTKRNIQVKNFADTPVRVRLVSDLCQDPATCTFQSFRTEDQHNIQFPKAVFFVNDSTVMSAVLAPRATGTLGPIYFRPTNFDLVTTRVFVKNNLTILEPVVVQGKGGATGIQFDIVMGEYGLKGDQVIVPGPETVRAVRGGIVAAHPPFELYHNQPTSVRVTPEFLSPWDPTGRKRLAYDLPFDVSYAEVLGSTDRHHSFMRLLTDPRITEQIREQFLEDFHECVPKLPFWRPSFVSFFRMYTATNLGNLPFHVSSIGLGPGGAYCSYHGLTIKPCGPFVVLPGKPWQLNITLRPELPIAVLRETLTMRTELGVLTQRVVVSLPPDMIKHLMDLLWEPSDLMLTMHKVCVASSMIAGAFVFMIYIRAQQFAAARLASECATSSTSTSIAAVVMHSSSNNNSGAWIDSPESGTSPVLAHNIHQPASSPTNTHPRHSSSPLAHSAASPPIPRTHSKTHHAPLTLPQTAATAAVAQKLDDSNTPSTTGNSRKPQALGPPARTPSQSKLASQQTDLAKANTTSEGPPAKPFAESHEPEQSKLASQKRTDSPSTHSENDSSADVAETTSGAAMAAATVAAVVTTASAKRTQALDNNNNNTAGGAKTTKSTKDAKDPKIAKTRGSKQQASTATAHTQEVHVTHTSQHAGVTGNNHQGNPQSVKDSTREAQQNKHAQPAPTSRGSANKHSNSNNNSNTKEPLQPSQPTQPQQLQQPQPPPQQLPPVDKKSKPADKKQPTSKKTPTEQTSAHKQSMATPPPAPAQIRTETPHPSTTKHTTTDQQVQRQKLASPVNIPSECDTTPPPTTVATPDGIECTSSPTLSTTPTKFTSVITIPPLTATPPTSIATTPITPPTASSTKSKSAATTPTETTSTPASISNPKTTTTTSTTATTTQPSVATVTQTKKPKRGSLVGTPPTTSPPLPKASLDLDSSASSKPTKQNRAKTQQALPPTSIKQPLISTKPDAISTPRGGNVTPQAPTTPATRAPGVQSYARAAMGLKTRDAEETLDRTKEKSPVSSRKRAQRKTRGKRGGKSSSTASQSETDDIPTLSTPPNTNSNTNTSTANPTTASKTLLSTGLSSTLPQQNQKAATISSLLGLDMPPTHSFGNVSYANTRSSTNMSPHRTLQPGSVSMNPMSLNANISNQPYPSSSSGLGGMYNPAITSSTVGSATTPSTVSSPSTFVPITASRSPSPSMRASPSFVHPIGVDEESSYSPLAPRRTPLPYPTPPRPSSTVGVIGQISRTPTCVPVTHTHPNTLEPVSTPFAAPAPVFSSSLFHLDLFQSKPMTHPAPSNAFGSAIFPPMFSPTTATMPAASYPQQQQQSMLMHQHGSTTPSFMSPAASPYFGPASDNSPALHPNPPDLGFRMDLLSHDLANSPGLYHQPGLNTAPELARHTLQQHDPSTQPPQFFAPLFLPPQPSRDQELARLRSTSLECNQPQPKHQGNNTQPEGQ